MEYLATRPEQLDDFFAFQKISNLRLLRVARETLGHEAVPDDVFTAAEEKASKVRERFVVTACESCRKTRVNHSWTQLDIVSMAKTTRALKSLVVSAYYFPMRHTHSTTATIAERIVSEEGSLSFQPDAQRSEADDALQSAHLCVLEVFATLQNHFSFPGADAIMDQLSQDFRRVNGIKEEE